MPPEFVSIRWPFKVTMTPFGAPLICIFRRINDRLSFFSRSPRAVSGRCRDSEIKELSYNFVQFLSLNNAQETVTKNLNSRFICFSFLENSPGKLRALIGLKSCFYLTIFL